MNGKLKSEWGLFWEFLKYRIKFPLKSIAFTLYFFTIIVLVGITSSFITVFNTINFKAEFDYNSISLTLIGYSLVLLCSSAIEFIFVGFKEDETKYKSLKNPMTMSGIATIIIGIVLSIVAYSIDLRWVKLAISILLIILVWLMWWISNSRTLSVLNDDYPPKVKDTTGGDDEIQGSVPNGYTS